jgi:DNA mismatch endonuclease, patch repair protein
MGRVRSKDTKPELAVRTISHAMGLRYRLHRRDLPGTPDLVFPRHKKVVFVHGCFWHLHGCGRYRFPRTRREFWTDKLDANKVRDEKNIQKLHSMGWDVLVIWECEVSDVDSTRARIRNFFFGEDR